jgi:asparagine N-glycosylation enzyme membrane subunit Stt3
MPISRRALCVVYALIGIVALIGCWGNNRHYFNLSLWQAGVHFWGDTLVNAASRSITIDIFFLLLAAVIWMLLEARRLSIRWVWLYVLFGFFVTISAAFPAFLIHRERVLARADGSTAAGTLSVLDILGVVVLSLPSLAYTFLALSR